jgi:hypothetical protein
VKLLAQGEVAERAYVRARRCRGAAGALAPSPSTAAAFFAPFVAGAVAAAPS